MRHSDSYLNVKQREKKTEVGQFSIDLIDLGVRTLRRDKKFGVDTPHTPLDLVNILTDHLCSWKMRDKETAIGVFYTPEWAINLSNRGYTNITVITDEFDPFIQKLLTPFKINYIITDEAYDMKFDVIVGNPPFSAPKAGKVAGKRATELYTKFFAKSLQMADIVAMVLPTTDKKVQKVHNELLRDNANFIGYIDSSVFPGITMDMWYVICDKNCSEKFHENVVWSLKDKGNDIPWVKGSVNMTSFKNLTGGHGTSSPKKHDDVTIYHKVNKTHGLVTVYGAKDSVTDSQRFPSDGYAVLMPQTFADDGWSQVEIVKCTGNQAAFNGVNIVFTKTLSKAKSLVEFMKTDEFIREGNRVKQGFNNMNLTSLRSIRTSFSID